MSQLQAVLRRSVSHLDPGDDEARKRVFESARAAMVRLLFSYEPSLSTSEINRKIGEFDRIVSEIEQGMEPVEDEVATSLADGGWPEPRRPSRAPLVRQAERESIGPVDDWQPDEEFDGRSEPASGNPSPPRARSSPEREPLRSRTPPAVDEAEIDYEQEQQPDYEDDDHHNDDHLDDDRDEPNDRYETDDYDDYERPFKQSWGERVAAWTSAINGRSVLLSIGAVALLVAVLSGAGFLYSRVSSGKQESAQAPGGRSGTAVATRTSPPDDAPPLRAVTTTVERAPPPVLQTGALALETLVLFDGRDPTVFQSAPDNPVHFEGDADGGFVRVASSTVSTGTRLVIGRGVFERIAGRTIRMVVVGRGNKQSPAHGLRFAYQNGRTISPWVDVTLTDGYAALSGIWTVPKTRGGPESDALIIEPGIPGDGTAADIKSVRLEVLS